MHAAVIVVHEVQGDHTAQNSSVNPAHAEIADMGIMVSSTGATHIFKQFQDRMLRHSGHAVGSVDRASLDQCRDRSNPATSAQSIHKLLFVSVT